MQAKSINYTHTVAVVGNPNCGKTTLFNGLTGGNQRVGNWPGVTVERIEGSLKFEEKYIHLVDLPGIYSFSPFSEDEKVARDYLLSKRPDLVVNIVDATNLERNLYLTAQLIEMKIPTIVVLNMMDLAEKQKISIDIDHLSRHLELPVIAVSAVSQQGIKEVGRAIDRCLEKPVLSGTSVVYANEIEDIIKEWTPALREVVPVVGADQRWIALKILEQDRWITSLAFEKGCLSKKDIKEKLDSVESLLGEPADSVIADYKYGFIHGIAKDIISRIRNDDTFTDRVDRIVMHPVLGVPLFLIVMFLVFWVTINGGGSLIPVFDAAFGKIFVTGFEKLLYYFNSPDWLIAVLAGGIGTGIRTVAAFIPVIFTMFFMLSILEDSGYMARAAFVMDKFMGALGLPGKSFVPMIIGFGCTVPAILATRTLERKRDRILTIFMTPFMSCGARLTVYTVFAAAFFPTHKGIIVFSLYLAGIVISVGTGFLMRNTLLKGETSHLIMELPPYHSPRMKHILIHAWNSLKVFIFKAGKFIIIAAILLSFLNTFGVDGTFGNEGNEKSLLAKIGKTITPFFHPIGIEDENWPASVAIFTGLFAKEAVVGTLNALYGQMEDSSSRASTTGIGLLKKHFSRGGPQAYAYLLLILIYFPCIATLGVVFKEIGLGYTLLLAWYTTFLGWNIAALFYQISMGREILWIILPVLFLSAVFLLFRIIGRQKKETIELT